MKDLPFTIPFGPRPPSEFAKYAGCTTPFVNTKVPAAHVFSQLSRGELVADDYGYWVPATKRGAR